MCVIGLKEKRFTYVGPLQKGWLKETWRYRGADKSLARPGRKQATAREDFDFRIYYL